MKRSTFLKSSVAGAASIYLTPTYAFSNSKKELKISLAQWSLHKQIEAGSLNPIDFASISMERYQINAVDYVNSFYLDKATNEKFWIEMKNRSDQAGVKNLVMMVDDEGDLGNANIKERIQSVENHIKWLNASKLLGCETVRVNAFGASNKKVYKDALIDGMSRLAKYALKLNLNLVIENHGLYSSDAAFMAEIIKEVNMPNFGALPDFGNWCLAQKWGTTQFECEMVYDRYQGVAELLPYAKSVSAKSYNFNSDGEDKIIDYYKMIEIIKNSNYNGYIGIEYEGVELEEHQGIIKTKQLLQKVWNS